MGHHAGGGVGADHFVEILGYVSGYYAVACAEVDREAAGPVVEGEDAVVEVGWVGGPNGGVVGEGEGGFAEGCHVLGLQDW